MVEMEKIELQDIDVGSLRKLRVVGGNSDIYVKGDICFKFFKNLFPNEKDLLYRKFLEMDGIKIDSVVMPIDLIVKDGQLEGYTMRWINNALPLSIYFDTRFVDCKQLFAIVGKASQILREIHANGIICQDLSFDNILVSREGNVSYCDMDGCCYGIYSGPMISYFLKRLMVDYRREKIYIDENLDRVSMLLAFYHLLYDKEVQKLSRGQYNFLANHIVTLDRARVYVDEVVNKKGRIPEVPYLDELIVSSDDYVIDRNKRYSLAREIFKR